MAEGFAKLYGKDVIIASSSGLAPTQIIAHETIACMREKEVDLSLHYPKRYDPYITAQLDLIINMSGFDLPEPVDAPVRNWMVCDPFGQSEEIYRASRDHIERQVMQLILQLRREEREAAAKAVAAAKATQV